MTTKEKCLEIIKAIVAACNEQPETDAVVVGFTPDWSGNSLTVQLNRAHSHVGDPGATFSQLVDDLHNMLVNKNGLSFVADCHKQVP